MADLVLIDGDQAVFDPGFGLATVVVRPGRLPGNGPTTLAGQRLCVVGDEARVSVRGCMYMTSQYSIPGVGTLEIAALADDQKARKTRSGRTPVLLVGRSFTAKFTVETPAQQVIQRRALPAIGHMDHLDPGLALEELTPEMGWRAEAR